MTFVHNKHCSLLVTRKYWHMAIDTVPDGHRNPFACSSCSVLYTSLVSSESAPCHLNGCSHTMCVKCVREKRVETDMGSGGRKLSIDCAVCGRSARSDPEPKRALTLIGLISELQTRQNKNPSVFEEFGIENERLGALDCTCCMKQYTHVGYQWPFVLDCGHTMCAECVGMERFSRTLDEKAKMPEFSWKVECFVCDMWTHFACRTRGAHVEDAMEWLDEKRKEKGKHQFTCCDCAQKTPFDRGFLCTVCTTNDEGKQRLLCAFCTYVFHKEHSPESLLPIKLHSMKDGCTEYIQSNIVKCNEDASGVVDEYRTLLGKVEERFSSAINTIPSSSTCSNGVQIARSLKRKAQEYTNLMREIVPGTRRYNSMLQDMLSNLDESFPNSNRAGGESEETEENGETETNGETEAKRPKLDEVTNNGGNKETAETEI